MYLEKEKNSIKWFKENNLKIRIKNEGEKSIVSVILKGFNICLRLAMYDFIDKIKADLLLDVTIGKYWDGKFAILINSYNSEELLIYIPVFLKEWNIKIGRYDVLDSDIISDELWYGDS